MTGWDPELLLAGPRGRRLCWEILPNSLVGPAWDRAWLEDTVDDGAALAEELSTHIARSHTTRAELLADPKAVLAALAAAVDNAAYWQEPDGIDVALAESAVRESLLPVATAISESPATQWWDTPLDLSSQHQVVFEGLEAPRPTVNPLQVWREKVIDYERTATAGGHWWSTPALSGLTSSTRLLPSLGPAGLSLVEDGMGWTGATSYPLNPSPGVRILEITGPGDWIRLVDRYPLDLTRSYQQSWQYTTGRTGDWVIPDFAAAAADYDAIHVTVVAYLSTAGRALATTAAATMLAGWDPDQTWWLTAPARAEEAPLRWATTSRGQPVLWTQHT